MNAYNEVDQSQYPRIECSMQASLLSRSEDVRHPERSGPVSPTHNYKLMNGIGAVRPKIMESFRNVVFITPRKEAVIIQPKSTTSLESRSFTTCFQECLSQPITALKKISYTVADTDGSGVLTHKDYMKSALRYAILYCKGERQQDVWNMVFDTFNGIWAEIKGDLSQTEHETLTFDEWRGFVIKLGSTVKQFEDLSKPMQQLIDLLFESYDAYNDNAVDENEYRLYLCARNMDLKRAGECFSFMSGGQKNAKFKRPQFRALMVDYLTSWDTNSKGKYICGPYDSCKRTILEEYLASVKKTKCF
ncbi:sterol carrier protein 2 [Chamberlinius hualienensis]